MLLRNRVILLLGLTAIVFLMFRAIDTINSSWLYLSIATILLISCLFILLNHSILNRIIKLKNRLPLIDFTKGQKQALIPVQGFDEIADMIKEINRLISESQEIHDS